MNAGHALVKFRDEATRDMVLEAGVVHFDRKPVLLRPWSTDLDTLRLVKSVPVWIRLPDLGLQYWGLKCLSALVSTIGKPMMMDKVTKEKSMVKFARVLVDVEITDHLPHSISFINERGQLMEQAIEFEWLPTRCSCCKGLGHTASSCKHAQAVVRKPKQKITSSEKGEHRGATVLYESGLENKLMDVNQMVVGKEAQTTSKGDQPAIKGNSKDTLITTTEGTNEASCSMTGKEKPWSTPKKVGGLRKKGSFLETKLHSNKIEEMMHDVFVGWSWYNSRAIEGRILLVWNQDLVHVAIVQERDQLVTCEVQIKGVSQIAILSFVYGGFNVVFEYDDQIGGRHITAMEVEDSSQWREKSLLIELRSSGVRPYRYFNMWDKHKDFRSTILSIWSKPAGGVGLQKIIQKLKRLKPALIQFNKMQIGNVVQNYATAKQNYELAQLMLHQSPSSNLLQQEEDEAAAEYARMSKLYEIFLRQKSKINWLRFGDENTAYFHASFLGKSGALIGRVDLSCFQQGTVLSLDQQLDLIHPFSKKDVKRALFNIPTTKSLGPDGYGSGFYKAPWKDIGDEISEAILMFFDSGVILTELNGIILSLIPKVVSPSKATDYRPIAFCNTLYKCISKMICFRLAKGLPVIIHQNQGAFIQNRQLAHNILILQEILHGYSRKNISPRCVIKIDLSKAYDSVDWTFMEDILNAFCFPRKFIQWIINCLTGTSYTLMFNGRLQGSFEGRKGLRQGDPISPLLFVLAMEYLTRLLNQASHHKEFRYHPLCKNLQLVNLCFADDLILFCKGNSKSVQILFDGFLMFCHCSGLEANLSKSQVFFGGVAAEVRTEILRSVALGEGSFPLKYLGVSLRPTRWLIADCGEIIKKIHNRLHVCLPKVLGGLGFKEGSIWNKVLLAKYLWALSSKQDVLWVKWIDGVYLKGNSVWAYQLKPDMEPVGYVKAVWSSLSVPRHHFILWQSILGHLLTRDNLVWCHIEINSVTCPASPHLLGGQLLENLDKAQCKFDKPKDCTNKKRNVRREKAKGIVDGLTDGIKARLDLKVMCLRKKLQQEIMDPRYDDKVDPFVDDDDVKNWKQIQKDKKDTIWGPIQAEFRQKVVDDKLVGEVSNCNNPDFKTR
ncbi:uncharacterized protein LOC133796130 [Humulus lupulus]|uniref:uncharacterized protein LOC133796130 n=1 Tax=Humulus lupulus TaxID=3486 RepID=UPI002B4169EB|nr:uncharacterized protein LOC133796130 [Humulus lupulus]